MNKIGGYADRSSFYVEKSATLTMECVAWYINKFFGFRILQHVTRH